MSTSDVHSAQAARLPLAEPEAGNYFVAVYPPFSAWSTRHIPAFHKALSRPDQHTPLGLYVHLPYCPQKCDYCYYLSYIDQKPEVVDRYIGAVTRELERYSECEGVKGRPVNFVYFGGGTPSTLSSNQLLRLTDELKRVLPWNRETEVTYECAPRSVRAGFLATMREAGVTRVSMGAQSFDNQLLKLNGRVHMAEDVERAFQHIRAAGFKNVNLDLMCGLLGETEQLWHDSVRKMIELGPDSVTIYQTEIPHNTPLYHKLEQGALPTAPVSWDIKRKRLDHGFRELERNGYSVASAYHAVRDPQRHRFAYQDSLWRGGDMLGLGVAAFGYFGGVHFQNEVAINKYEAAVDRGEVPTKRAYALSPRERLIRAFILQLKLGAVAAEPFRRECDVEITEVFSEPLNTLKAGGFVTLDDDQVRLTRPGLLRVDRLLPLFYDPRFQDLRYT